MDLDFFVSPTPIGFDTTQGRRASAKRFQVASVAETADFIRDHLSLSEATPVPGRESKTHDGAFWHWKHLIELGVLTVPFDVVHVDNHADLGLGDGGWFFLTSEWLHRPVSERTNPPAERVEEGNYLAFAIAARWIRSVTYVAPDCRFHDDGEYRHEDRMPYYFEERRPEMGRLSLPVCRQGCSVFEFNEENDLIGSEPVIPFATVRASQFFADGHFDWAFLAQSPRYTPRAADALLPEIRKYIDTSAATRSRP